MSVTDMSDGQTHGQMDGQMDKICATIRASLACASRANWQRKYLACVRS